MSEENKVILMLVIFFIAAVIITYVGQKMTPPRECSTFGNTEISRVPARCASQYLPKGATINVEQ